MNRIQLICDLLISYLKQNHVKHIVISSGTRAIPFIRAIENDDYFVCYSVIDERNATFYALGISQQLNVPVGVTCTSGTAASNYLSGMTEAYYAHTTLVAITADRSMQVLNQLETQKIDQPAIFESVTKKSICLPIIKDQDDFWYAKRLLDEVFLSMRQHGKGPIHINLPIEGTTNDITIQNQDNNYKGCFTQLKWYSQSEPRKWEEAVQEIKKYNKILVVIGQFTNIDQSTINAISKFCHNRRIPIIGDNLSNFRCDEMIFSQAPIKGMSAKTFETILPDLVISIGNNFQERIKDHFKAHRGKVKHWLIDESGIVRDWSKSLTALFECDTKFFFDIFNEDNATTNGKYLEQWKGIEKAAKIPDNMPWSNFYLVKEFSKVIPENSILHLAILNATRLMQFFRLPESVKVTCNASSFGIDGCLPTLIGQSVVAPNKLAFILIGDLSFFYGMNALSIRGISENVRILLSNNGGGAEFHIYPHTSKDSKLDLHIAASHGFDAKGWAKTVGFDYLSANNEESLNKALNEFVSDCGDKPKLLEVFTDLHFDGEYCLDVYKYIENNINGYLNKSI